MWTGPILVGLIIDSARHRAVRATSSWTGSSKGASFCFIAVRQMGITPHVAQHTTKRRSAIDGLTTRHPGYALSQRSERRSSSPAAG